MSFDYFRRNVQVYDDMAVIQRRLGLNGNSKPDERPDALWLSQRAVDGFAPDDFAETDPPVRDRLAELVARFREVAARPKDASPADLERAAGWLREIADILEVDRYAGEGAYQIGKQIERSVAGQLPEWVADLRFEADTDSTGDPALWVRVLMRDDLADEVAGAEVDTLQQRLFAAARDADPDRWPYIRFRTVSEQAEADEFWAGRT